MKILMEAINYDKFKWQICGDLQLGLQQGFTKCVASFVNGTAELGLFIIQENIGLPENLWNQESGMWKITH